MLSVTIKSNMINVIMLSVTIKSFMLNVTVLSVIMLNVVAPRANVKKITVMIYEYLQNARVSNVCEKD